MYTRCALRDSPAPRPCCVRARICVLLRVGVLLFLKGDGKVAIKCGVGKVNALTGQAWAPGLSKDPQNYMVRPEQPWLDGVVTGDGVVRQFVAMPLGMGVTVEVIHSYIALSVPFMSSIALSFLFMGLSVYMYGVH